MAPEEERVTREELDRVMKILRHHVANQISALIDLLRKTQCDLVALAGLLTTKGVQIDAKEWSEASRAIAEAGAVDKLFDPRLLGGEAFYARLMRGEQVPHEELDAWFREIRRDEESGGTGE